MDYIRLHRNNKRKVKQKGLRVCGSLVFKSQDNEEEASENETGEGRASPLETESRKPGCSRDLMGGTTSRRGIHQGARLHNVYDNSSVLVSWTRVLSYSSPTTLRKPFLRAFLHCLRA